MDFGDDTWDETVIDSNDQAIVVANDHDALQASSEVGSTISKSNIFLIMASSNLLCST